MSFTEATRNLHIAADAAAGTHTPALRVVDSGTEDIPGAQQYVNITPSTRNFPNEGWGSRGWGRRVDGATFFGTIDDATKLDSNIVGITDRYILYKRSTPSTKRPRSIEINGRSHTVSTSVVPWGGTWGGQDNNLVSYSSWSAPSGNWPRVVITL